MQQHPARSRPGDPLRVAIYARVSSEQQAERHTIDSQVNDLMARAAADGREVGAELRFIDEGVQRRQSGPARLGAPARYRRLVRG